MAKVDFATANLFWRELLVYSSHAAEIVITMTAHEMDVNDFYRSTHIYSAF